MRLRHGAATDVGRIRSVNQDRVLALPDRFYAVADGMGGHRGGDTAAQIAVDTIGTAVQAAQPLRTGAVVAAIERANRLVIERSYADDALTGMGTTVTALAVVAAADGTDLLLVTNVGDSRTYWLRGGEFEQLTEDHSVVAELIREGALRPDQAATHPTRSYVTRALGAEPTVEVDAIEIVAAAGDRFVLCSDGLSGEVTDAAIAAVLRRLEDPQEAADELVRLALGRGGRDNVSVVVVDVVDDDDAAWTASQQVAIDGFGHRRSSEPGPDGPGPDEASADGDGPTRKATDATTAARAETGDGPASRRPPSTSLVTWRLMAFAAAVAAIVGVVVWVIRSGDSRPPVAVPSTTQSQPTTLPIASSTLVVPSTLLGLPTTAAGGAMTRKGPETTLSLGPSTSAASRPSPSLPPSPSAAPSPSLAPTPSVARTGAPTVSPAATIVIPPATTPSTTRRNAA